MNVLIAVRRLSSPLRVLPDFLLIGGQRCGTTSLYNYLIQHPGILPSLKKEVHYFDLNYDRGISWYEAHFPTSIFKYCISAIKSSEMQTGEASPYYLFHPAVPERVAKTIPQVKLIALLRDPVHRAYSHYHHEVRQGRETLTFEEAIQKELNLLEDEEQIYRHQDDKYWFKHQRFYYISRGLYADQIKHWTRFFSADQFLILKSEELYDSPANILKRVFNFLGMHDIEINRYDTFNMGSYPKIDPSAEAKMRKYFEPKNRELYDHIGLDFNW